MADEAEASPDGRRPTVVIGAEIARGGEGRVCEVDGRPDLVAKIYLRPPTRAKQDKLRLMTGMRVGPLRDLAAWPLHLVAAAAGPEEVGGFLMRRVTGHEDVHMLYGPKSRRERFPGADFRFVVRAASNVARAFAAAHAADVVIGDVNFGGVTVARDATVTLLDCDSFQVRGPADVVHHCEVAMPLFTPPELVGKPLAATERTANHDAFGLAVLIFQLLMMGRHPFAGRYAGEGEMTAERAVAELRYVYGRDAALKGMRPPPGVPPVAQVAGQAVAEAFERAFSAAGVTAARPTAVEWASLMDALFAALGRCPDDAAHWAVDPGECPWCAAEDASGVAMYGDGSAGLAQGLAPPARIEAAAAEAMALALPAERKFEDPAPVEAGKRRRFPKTVLICKIVVFVLALRLADRFEGLSALVMLFLSWTFGAGLVDLVVGRFKKKNPELEALLEKRQDALARRALALAAYAELCGRQRKELSLQAVRVEAVLAKWREMPKLRAARLREVRLNMPEAQLVRHLRRFPIEGARIPRIGAQRRQALALNDVVTAADVRDGMDVPGFGPTLIRELTAWRDGLAAGFVYDPSLRATRAEVDAAKAEVVALQLACEKALLGAAKRIGPRIAEFAAARTRAESDVEAIDREIAAIDADIAAAR